MALIVQKYGGTSVGSVERIHRVAEQVAEARGAGHDLVVVLSAMSGETDRLVRLAHEVTPSPDEREMDMLLATGEQVTIALLAMALQSLGVKARSFTGPQIGMRTDHAHTQARITQIDADRVRRALRRNKEEFIEKIGELGVPSLSAVDVHRALQSQVDSIDRTLSPAFGGDSIADFDGLRAMTQEERDRIAMTGVDRVAFFNTGSEAVMSALRLARTVTARPKVVMFAGSYHGHSDGTLAERDPSKGPLDSSPVAPGIPRGVASDVLVLDYGAPESLELLRAHGKDIGAVLVEPVQSRRPELRPVEFLRDLRRLTRETGTALIFDEMITGFRVHPAGAQGLFGVQADLATYGKIVGGGLPVGVFVKDMEDGGRYILYNAACGEIVGFEPSYIVGRTDSHRRLITGALPAEGFVARLWLTSSRTGFTMPATPAEERPP